MKLYMHPAACSLSPHIVCRELGLPVELVPVDVVNRRVPDGRSFAEINGNGYVPVLELADGTRLTEGPAIVQYLADLKPELGLVPPAGSIERVRLQAWLNFVTSELHKPMVMMFYPAYAAARDAIEAHVRRRLDWLAGEIGDGFLLGETFTAADAYLFVCLNWSPWIGLDIAQWPRLRDFMRRVAARPAVQAALAAEGLVKADPSGALYAPAKAAQ